MSRRGRADVAIVGGGVVGATCALALSRLDLEVVLVEAAEPARWRPDAAPDLRVYAFAPDNAALLAGLDVWPQVVAARAQAYRRMRVWDAAGGGELAFDADAFGRSELGWIVEHGLLVDRIWARLPVGGIRMRCPARVEAMTQDENGVELRLDDGSRVHAGVAIAADGADSTLRRLAGIAICDHDYAQRGVVAYVSTEHPHQATAWQRFLPGGPLAFLPCADGTSSIVWTLPRDEAERVLALDDAAFADALTRAFDARLGRIAPVSRRAAFPLRRRLAETYVSGRVLALGDAAHVVHPLAGQGVNLGLRDVAALAATVAGAMARRMDWATSSRLRRWARTRRSENALAARAFDAINLAFSNDHPLATVLRGPLLGLAGRLPPATRTMWRLAAGL
ncbi:MAG: UbiH/UbiF family hydroxylase [Gammaproteobacteria bacterium]|nr:UbiH/UbiF family hydroxylase [Gammaproteobacteria bacterium]